MNYPNFNQAFQDWCTQQWVILGGRKIDFSKDSWLSGPFGNLNGIGEEFIYQLAEKENLLVHRNSETKGLLLSIKQMGFPEKKIHILSKNIIDFYERTSCYDLQFSVKWNPFFKFFGILVNKLFSSRINQLNIPLNDTTERLSSEIITLTSPKSSEVVYTVWLRKVLSTGRVVYSGIYSTCEMPSGKICVKAVFPLPMGNATVLMNPIMGEEKELILDSSGKNFGDAGFYFLLEDGKGNRWARFVPSFEDKLTIKEEQNILKATQQLKLWKQIVATFSYTITRK